MPGEQPGNGRDAHAGRQRCLLDRQRAAPAHAGAGRTGLVPVVGRRTPGAEATITLPGQATAGPDMPGKAATLRLRTVNGNSFELALKTN